MAHLAALPGRLVGLLLLAATPQLIYARDTSSKPIEPRLDGVEIACSALSAKFPDRTFYSGDDDDDAAAEGYAFETRTQYWSALNYKSPACVFVPQTADEVSFAVTTFTLTQSRFAVRGGGHMPVVGSNSIDSTGILLSLSGLDTLGLSEDTTVVSVGSGNRWRDVYDFLEPHSLTAVGGRVGGVGVPGLLLGGGISFHSSQYGFASDNVALYEAVLASGEVVEATVDNEHSDLNWALRGGGNSFAIVTRFDLRTVPSPGVWVGISQYSATDSESYLDAVYNFGRHGSADTKAAIIPTIVTLPSFGFTAYAASRFYDSAEEPPATVFENFTAPMMVPVEDSYGPQSLAAYVRDVDALQPTGLRQDFRVLSILVDREAVSFVHNTFLEATAGLSAIPDLTASITFQPVTEDFIKRGICRGGGQNPQGVDQRSAPYFWIVQNLSWASVEYDDVLVDFSSRIATEIQEKLAATGVTGKFLYMNDAGEGQPVFEGYPAENLARLKDIRASYDPLQVYTNLLVGGWKVLDA